MIIKFQSLDYNKIGLIIRRERKAFKLSQTELGLQAFNLAKNDIPAAQSKIKRIEQGKKTKIEDLYCVANALNIATDELGLPSIQQTQYPVQPIITILGAKIQVPEGVQSEDYYAVPMVAGRIAAGHGHVVQEDIESLVWVYKPEIGKRRNLIAVKLDDDAVSMQPKLEPGYIVIIDRDDWKVIKNDAIYAIRLGKNQCSIKRLTTIEDKAILIYGDNREAFKPVTTTKPLQDLIVGRVVWFWGSLI